MPTLGFAGQDFFYKGELACALILGECLLLSEIRSMETDFWSWQDRTETWAGTCLPLYKLPEYAELTHIAPSRETLCPGLRVELATADIKLTSACLGKAITNVAQCSLGEESPKHSSLAQTDNLVPQLPSLVGSRAREWQVKPAMTGSTLSSDLAWPMNVNDFMMGNKRERAGRENKDEIRFTMRHQMRHR